MMIKKRLIFCLLLSVSCIFQNSNAAGILNAFRFPKLNFPTLYAPRLLSLRNISSFSTLHNFSSSAYSAIKFGGIAGLFIGTAFLPGSIYFQGLLFAYCVANRSLEQKITAVHNDVKKVDKKADNIQASINGVKNTINDNEEQRKAAELKAQTERAMLKTIAETNELNRKTAEKKVEEARKGMQQTLNNHTAQLKDISTRQDAAQTTFENFQTRYIEDEEKRKKDAEIVQNNLNGIQNTLCHHGQQLGTIILNVETVNKNITELKNDVDEKLEKLGNKIDEGNERVLNLLKQSRSTVKTNGFKVIGSRVISNPMYHQDGQIDLYSDLDIKSVSLNSGINQ